MTTIGHLQTTDASKIRIGQYRLFVDYYRKKGRLIIHAMRRRSNAYK